MISIPRKKIYFEINNNHRCTIRFESDAVGFLDDIETADRYAFFSLHGPKWGVTLSEENLLVKEDQKILSLKCQTNSSLWHLKSEHFASNDQMARHQSIDVLEPSTYQDFVARFLFRKDIFPIGRIASKRLEHVGSNKWHQYPVDHIELEGDNHRVTVKVNGWDGAGFFTQEMYLRDEPGDWWIVHARLMPIAGKALPWIRWDTRFGRLIDLTGGIARAFLSASFIKSKLWYAAERRGKGPNLQAQCLAHLPAGTRISLSTVCHITEPRG